MKMQHELRNRASPTISEGSNAVPKPLGGLPVAKVLDFPLQYIRLSACSS